MKTNTTPYSKVHHGIIRNKLGRARYSLHDGQRGCWPTSSGMAGGFCCARASSRVFLALSAATMSAKAIHQIVSTRRMRPNKCMPCECWLTVILGQSHPRKGKVQNLIHHGAKHEGLTLTCQVGRRSGGKRALFQPVPRLNCVLCRIRTKSCKDKVMGPSERRADGGFPSVPGMIFTNWREALNAAALPGAVRAGYTLAVAGYLDYCRRNGIKIGRAHV